MKGGFHALGALALTVAGTVALGAVWPRAQESVDLFLITVVYYAITRPRTVGLAMGAAVGLAADVFGSQLLGFQGFVKTGVAYAVGGLGSKFMLNQPVPQVLALLLATLADAALAWILSTMIGRPPAVEGGVLVKRLLFNPLVGLIIYRLIQRRRGHVWAANR